MEAGIESRRLDLARAVERARKTRLAFVDSSVVPGLSAVSSPVLQWNGEAAAAVTLIGRSIASVGVEASAKAGSRRGAGPEPEDLRYARKVWTHGQNAGAPAP